MTAVTFGSIVSPRKASPSGLAFLYHLCPWLGVFGYCRGHFWGDNGASCATFFTSQFHSMFSTISWAVFFTWTGAAVALYYAVVLYVFYRKQFSSLFSRKLPSGPRNLSIPIVNGKMGSVLFDDDEPATGAPTPAGPGAAFPDEEDQDEVLDDDYDDEAEQARQYALLDQLVNDLTDIISGNHRLPTDDVFQLLKDRLSDADPTVYLRFKESLTEDVINKFYEYRGSRVTSGDLRTIWP